MRIAIDDFGTGYSNLAYLRRLPVHALKLAGSFVTGAAGRGRLGWRPVRQASGEQVDREVVGLVIRLAHTLGLTVTAESVETAAQFAAPAAARLRHRAGLVLRPVGARRADPAAARRAARESRRSP